MASPLRRLVAVLETIMFQIDEIHEGMDTVHELSYNAKSQTLSELKDLRVAMIKAKKELDLSRDENDQYDYTERYDKLVVSAKKDIDSLKSVISSVDNSHERAQSEQEARLRKEVELKNAERLSKANAFQRSVNEVRNMYASLLKAYSIVDLDTSRDSMLKRDKEKQDIASKFNKMRDRVDTLTLRSDVLMNNKEEMLDEFIQLVRKIESMKERYEEKVHQDLVDNDLTPEKLKLAGSTPVNFGKFSGSLGKGDDFYTFKSKFLKAYSNHPKDMKIHYLKSNHLEGLAKEYVGSLENIDEIWERLKGNFGNTEVMLKYHFGRINKMGQMHTFKSFDLKKTYVQCLINAMNDVKDLAQEHNLMGDVIYGPHLVKVVGLLEKHCQNEWYKILSEENVDKPQRWERMITYLISQLSIIQIRSS